MSVLFLARLPHLPLRDLIGRVNNFTGAAQGASAVHGLCPGESCQPQVTASLRNGASPPVRLAVSGGDQQGAGLVCRAMRPEERLELGQKPPLVDGSLAPLHLQRADVGSRGLGVRLLAKVRGLPAVPEFSAIPGPPGPQAARAVGRVSPGRGGPQAPEELQLRPLLSPVCFCTARPREPASSWGLYSIFVES